jgi:uncharacterized protein (TIGR02268 family)
VCIAPGYVTTVIFEEPLAPGAVALDEAGQRIQVAQAGRFLTLLPAASLLPGERLRLTVRFGDGAAPAEAPFFLVVHPARAQHLVAVFRRKRMVESYQGELKEKEEEARRLREENEQLRAAQGKPDGLRGLFSVGLMGEGGVAVADLSPQLKRHPGNALQVRAASIYRSSARIALTLRLQLPAGTEPWTAYGAALVDAAGREVPLLALWQPAPVAPGAEDWAVIMVEAEATAEEATGPFTLKLWEASGKRSITLAGVIFPVLPRAAAR